MNLNLRKTISVAILVTFLANTFGPVPSAQAQEFRLPAPGVMVHLSPEFNPPILKGIKVHPDNPFRFDFILDKGGSSLSSPNVSVGDPELKQEATTLIKYFLASLTIPEKDLWVNLSPYEKNRIVPESFGQTEMGRDLLAEDYMLKQITASLIYPEDEVGKRFWKRIYEEAAKKFGTTNIPVNTFNKVWIVPEKAVVYENAKSGTAYVVESKLKVMLEQDYFSLEKHEGIQSISTVIPAKAGIHNKNDINALGSQIVREIVIPELTKEVNENKNFVQLRQVYNSLILATWYKKKIKESILAHVYTDKNKVAGVNIDDPQEMGRIYQLYLKAFKKGVYNYIKDEIDLLTQETIPRKYFSGGVVLTLNLTNLNTDTTITVIDGGRISQAMLTRINGDTGNEVIVAANILPFPESSDNSPWKLPELGVLIPLSKDTKFEYMLPGQNLITTLDPIKDIKVVQQIIAKHGFAPMMLPLDNLPLDIQERLNEVPINIGSRQIKAYDFLRSGIDEIIFSPYLKLTAKDGKEVYPAGYAILDNRDTQIAPGKRIIFVNILTPTDILAKGGQVGNENQNGRDDLFIAIIHEAAHKLTQKLISEGKLDAKFQDNIIWIEKIAYSVQRNALINLSKEIRAGLAGVTDEKVIKIVEEVLAIFEIILKHTEATMRIYNRNLNLNVDNYDLPQEFIDAVLSDLPANKAMKAEDQTMGNEVQDKVHLYRIPNKINKKVYLYWENVFQRLDNELFTLPKDVAGNIRLVGGEFDDKELFDSLPVSLLMKPRAYRSLLNNRNLRTLRFIMDPNGKLIQKDHLGYSNITGLGIVALALENDFIVFESGEGIQSGILSHGHLQCTGLFIKGRKNGKQIIAAAHILSNADEYPDKYVGDAYKKYQGILRFLKQQRYTDVHIGLMLNDKTFEGFPKGVRGPQLVAEARRLGFNIYQIGDKQTQASDTFSDILLTSQQGVLRTVVFKGQLKVRISIADLDSGKIAKGNFEPGESHQQSKVNVPALLKPNKTGGIDLTPANLNLQTQNPGKEIKFYLDPAMLKQLQNAPGFVPIIINIQPMTNLALFLGINPAKEEESLAKV